MIVTGRGRTFRTRYNLGPQWQIAGRVAIVLTSLFAKSHTLLVDKITIKFFANGSNNNLAACEYRPAAGDVIFQSDPTG